MAINYTYDPVVDGVTDACASYVNHMQEGLKNACDGIDDIEYREVVEPEGFATSSIKNYSIKVAQNRYMCIVSFVATITGNPGRNEWILTRLPVPKLGPIYPVIYGADRAVRCVLDSGNFNLYWSGFDLHDGDILQGYFSYLI